MKTTVKLQGGLGNQLFQYAFGRALMEKAFDVTFDKSFFTNNTKYTPRPFSLQAFKLNSKVKIEDVPHTRSFWKKVLNRIDGDRNIRYVKKFLERPDSYMDGYYNSEKYFKNIRNLLLKELELKQKSEKYLEIENIIKNSKSSLMIHARRTDYLSSTGFTILDIDYYKRGLSLFPKDIPIFTFSDDPEWLGGVLGRDVYVVSGQGLTDYEELSLMSLGQNFIIANSTFSWWGAWLATYENKKVVAPQSWFRSRLWWRANRDVVPSEWVRV